MKQVSAGNRVEWIDAARGIGIILVVYGHSGRALMSRLPEVQLFQALDAAIYHFHMPLFFFLAGLVVQKSLVRGRPAYLRDKLRNVVYPYLLWSIVFGGLQVLMSGYTNHTLEVEGLAKIAWQPIGHLWFLYALFLCQILLLVIWPSKAGVVVAAIAVVALSLPYPLTYLSGSFPYFVAGLFVSSLLHGERVIQAKPTTALLTLLAALLFVAAFMYVRPLTFPSGKFAISFSLAFLGIAAVVGSAMLAQGSTWLTLLGRASLAIFVLHTIFGAGLRITLDQVAPVSPLLTLALTFAVGLLLPLPLYRWAVQHGMALQLGLGGQKPSRRHTRLTDGVLGRSDAS